jgi:hypothetical protein
MEIGSTSLEALCDIAASFIKGYSSLTVLTQKDQYSGNYIPSTIGMGEVIHGLSAEFLVSAAWSDLELGVRYVLLWCPNFGETRLGLWVCTVAYSSENWQELWGKLEASPSLRFACVCREEGLSITDDQLSPDTFPWSDPSLLAAAVRSDSGEWISHMPEDSVSRIPQNESLSID